MSEARAEPGSVAHLCPACGLCCNGVLFKDVELTDADKPEALGALKFVRKGRKKAFKQPCACFDGKLCRIYDARPARCRTFECTTLKRLQEGTVTLPEALRTIHRAQRQVAQVRDLIRRLGDSREDLPLSRRYARIMAQPMDLTDHQNAELRARLMLEVDQLMKRLHQDFLA
ncbi:MAG: YkgJ family cysteine cluster protein [Verrucomicrobiia bacterium]